MSLIDGVCFLSLTLAAFTSASAVGASPAQPSDKHSAAAPTSTARTGSYLGVGVVELDSARIESLGANSETGVQVVHLREGSPAEKAGLRVGDILLTFNGENIMGGQQLGRLVSETPVGRHVKLSFWRDGNVQSCTVTTAAAPDVTSELQANMRALGEQVGRLHFSMPMDIPTPLLVWQNRMLGIIIEPLDAQLADYFGVKEGVLVRYVEKGSVADEAGMRSGDVVTSLEGQPISKPLDLSTCMRNQTATGHMTVSITRDHKSMKLKLTPAEASR